MQGGNSVRAQKPITRKSKLNAMKTCLHFLFAASIFALVGCNEAHFKTPVSEVTHTTSEATDTSRLDDIAKFVPNSAEFVRRVKLYYEALQKKDWPTTYNMRTAQFKQDVTKEYYLKEMADDGKRWNLDSYRVLGVHQFGNEAAEIIFEFRESGSLSYSSAWWKNKDGTWVCDEPGLSEGLLRSTRVPDWIKD
jgi:hypothetical protein